MPGNAARPQVYVIVVNYNGWRDTIECLESVLRSDYPALRVIVCDNASTDDSVAAMRGWARGEVAVETSSPRAPLRADPVVKPVRLIECTAEQLVTAGAGSDDESGVLLVHTGGNLGFAGANNVALRHVLARGAGAYALLFNNDAVIAPDAITAMVDRAERTTACGAIGATVLRYFHPDRIETLGGGRISRLTGMVSWVAADKDRHTSRPESVAIDYVMGCCLLAPYAAIQRVGLMGEQYFLYGEDADWCLRMKSSGLAVGYCAAAEIWHKGGASVAHRSEMHDYYAVRGTLMLMHRHFAFSLPLVLGHAVFRFLLPKLARGEWRRLRAAARGYRDFIRYAARPREQAA